VDLDDSFKSSQGHPKIVDAPPNSMIDSTASPKVKIMEG
jgi:hypothetical protein